MGKRWAKAVGTVLAAALCAPLGAGCAAEKSEFTVTIFSDVHHGDYNYNDFACTDGLKKLEKILIETDFLLANLGQCHIAVRFGNLHFAPALTPVENRDRHADFHHLVSF